MKTLCGMWGEGGWTVECRGKTSVHITGYKFIIEISQAQLTFNPVWRDKRRPRDNGKYRLPTRTRTELITLRKLGFLVLLAGV